MGPVESNSGRTPLDRCPFPDCSGRTSVAGRTEIIAGQPLWTCTDGHSGPRVLGLTSDSYIC